MRSSPPEVDPDVVADVAAQYPVELAVLFGSHARARASPQSDVDVAVAFEEGLEPSERLELRIALTVDLVETLGTDDVDVADLESTKPAVAASALDHGIVLVGDREAVESTRERLDVDRSDDGSHEDRMRRFDDLLDRLEAEV